jgi:ATP synthase protein I
MANEVEPGGRPKGPAPDKDRAQDMSHAEKTREDKAKGMSPADGFREDKALAERLGALDRRLKAAEGERAVRRAQEAERPGPSGIGQALRLSSEFIAAIIVGGGLGWAADRWLGTSPWGMILLLMLGFAAGVMNVMRASGMLKPARGRDGGKDAGSGDR